MYAPGTHKNHRSQWKSYLAFCLYFDFKPVPATAHVIALYCQFLSQSLPLQSIRDYLSGVKLLHLIVGFDFPFLQSYKVCLTLKSIQHTVKHTPNRAPPITPDILSQLVSVTDLGDGKEVTFMCAFLFTFSSLFGFQTFFPKQHIILTRFSTFVEEIFLSAGPVC